MLRTGNKALAAATLLLDGVKGAVAVLLAGWLAGPAPTRALLAAGLGAVLGHLFPVWLRFRGGKGVATGLGVLIAAAWPVGLVACAVWLAWRATRAHLFPRRRWSAFAAAPLAALALGNRLVTELAAIIAVLVFVRHSRQHPPPARRHRAADW